MRELKFRCFFDNDGEHPSYMAYYEQLIAPEATNQDIVAHKAIDGVMYFKPKKPPILMQYTGLKDKNGKEIYEGDIVTGCYYKNTVSVEWIDEDAGWFPFTQPAYGGYEWEADSPGSVEVIGNIYENPELMEK